VLRGGSWNNTENNARCAYRNNNNPNNRNTNNGFRVVGSHVFPGSAGNVVWPRSALSQVLSLPKGMAKGRVEGLVDRGFEGWRDQSLAEAVPLEYGSGEYRIAPAPGSRPWAGALLNH